MNHTTAIYHDHFQFPQTSIDFFLMAVIQNYRLRDLKSLVLFFFLRTTFQENAPFSNTLVEDIYSLALCTMLVLLIAPWNFFF